MMRYLLLIFFISSLVPLFGQTDNTILVRQIDSLRKELNNPQTDSTKAEILGRITNNYLYINPDSSISYGKRASELYEKIQDFSHQEFANGQVMYAYMQKGDLPTALEMGLNTISAAENLGIRKSGIGPTLDNLGLIYHDLGDNEKAFAYFRKMIDRGDVDIGGVAFGYYDIANVYESTNDLDSALLYLEKSREAFLRFHNNSNPDDVNLFPYQYEVYPVWYNLRAKVYFKQHKPELAMADLRTSLNITLETKEAFHTANTYNDIADFYIKMNLPDSGIFYAEKAITEANKISNIAAILNGSRMLAKLYEFRDPVKALEYYKLNSATEKKLYGAGNIQVLKDIISKDEKRRQELKTAESAYRTRLKQNILIGTLVLVLIVTIILFLNNRTRKKANVLLTKQKKEIEDTLGQLKSTQAQLIQSEKMASLGELTAGIAHEIQNPLNFVNNFSEVNSELIAEMKQEIDKGNLQEVKSIADTIDENEQKIIVHGKRADVIVKNMLQHSRSSSGVKEPTDINALADEYLRLAYHGLRAKDKSFNASFKTHLDNSIGKINIIPQDIGRVLVNLINNAFYAVTEKKKLGIAGYEPAVTVSTKKINGKVEIRVADNGNGIPQKVLDKIFQPFFTTKPTGQGTGLGLSLSYDIITKGHAGELKVETMEGEGATFILHLPLL